MSQSEQAQYEASSALPEEGPGPRAPVLDSAVPQAAVPWPPAASARLTLKTIDARRMASSAVLVMGLFMVGRVVGVLDDVVKAQLFGTSGELGAYQAAFRLPELLNNLLSAGALAAAFIPVFAELLTRDDREHAWRLASSVLNLTFLITLVLGLIIVAFAPQIVRTLIMPGWTAEHPELQEITASVMRLVVLSMVLWSISGIATSVLQAHQHFLLPAVAPILYNVGVVAGAVFLAPRFGVWGLAYGVVAGMALHVLIQIPGLVRYGMRWQPLIDLRDPDVVRVIKLTLPRMAGVSVIYLGTLIGDNLASWLPDPSAPSSLSYAWRIQQIPATIIGLGVATVLFPSFAAVAATGDRARLREMFSWSMRVMILLTVPAAVALLVLGRHAIGFVLRGGAFDASSTDNVMFALQFYALGLVGYSTLEVVARAMFAQQDTRTPLFVASGALVANATLGVLLLGPLRQGGLALASSLAVTGEVLMLMVILRRRLAGIDGRALAVTLARALIAAAAMALTILGLLALVAPLTLGLSDRMALLAELVVAAPAGLLVYVLAALLLGSQEIRALPALLLRRSAAVTDLGDGGILS